MTFSPRTVSRWSAVLLVAGSLALAGCSVPGTPAAGPGAASPAADPCAGAVGDCRVVTHADVDGDGSTEAVALVRGDAVAVRAVVGGALAEAAVPGPTTALLDPDNFVGAMNVTRSPGADIVLMLTNGGGQAGQFAVVGWDGGLTLVPSPKGGDLWELSNSHGTRESVSCTGDPGAVEWSTHTLTTREGVAQPGGGTATLTGYTFGGGAWSQGGSRTVARHDPVDHSADGIRTGTFLCPDVGTAPAEAPSAAPAPEPAQAPADTPAPAADAGGALDSLPSVGTAAYAAPWGLVFTTPLGSVSCGLGEGLSGSYGEGATTGPGVVCGVQNGYEGPAVPRPASCPGNIPWISDYVAVKGSQSAQGVCTGGAPFAPPAGGAKVLPYNQRLSHGGYSCTVLTTGVVCRHDASGGGFEISKFAVSTF